MLLCITVSTGSPVVHKHHALCTHRKPLAWAAKIQVCQGFLSAACSADCWPQLLAPVSGAPGRGLPGHTLRLSSHMLGYNIALAFDPLTHACTKAFMHDHPPGLRLTPRLASLKALPQATPCLSRDLAYPHGLTTTCQVHDRLVLYPRPRMLPTHALLCTAPAACPALACMTAPVLLCTLTGPLQGHPIAHAYALNVVPTAQTKEPKRAPHTSIHLKNWLSHTTCVTRVIKRGHASKEPEHTTTHSVRHWEKNSRNTLHTQSHPPTLLLLLGKLMQHVIDSCAKVGQEE